MKYDSKAVETVRMSDLTRETFERTCASRKFGTAIAARMAMIATTIKSSIRVKAVRVLMIWFLLIDRHRMHYAISADAIDLFVLGKERDIILSKSSCQDRPVLI